MANKLLRPLILSFFIMVGFLLSTDSAQAVYATTTYPSGYDFKNIDGDFVDEEKFWFDGEHFRFSFTPTKDFYTVWIHNGVQIAKHPFYNQYLSIGYWFENGGGGSTGGRFVDELSDLDGYSSGAIYFLWEAGQRYDTYIIDGQIPFSGITESDTLLDEHFNTYPDDKLDPQYSYAQFGIRYIDRVNHGHQRNYIDYDYNSIDPVIIVPGIMGSAYFGGQWVIDPILHTYDYLIEFLIEQGYEKDKNLFVFPYDWRQSNIYTASLLKNKINDIKSQTGKDKVDIVAHSMGGIVARTYIADISYEEDIDQLIFLATPHLGAPKSYLMWEAGEFDPGIDSFFLKFYFKNEAKKLGFDSIFDYIRNGPILSIQQLLPIYDYLYDGEDEIPRYYPDNYPQNNLLEILNSSPGLASLDSVRIENIIGNNGEESTINAFKTEDYNEDDNKWEHGWPIGFEINKAGFIYGPGDQTVPGHSNEIFLDLNTIIIGSDHNTMVSESAPLVYEKLLETAYTGPPINYSSYDNFLVLVMHSPADFVVTAPDGKKLGKDFVNNNITNEIPGAFYTGFDTDTEFVTIPNPLDGSYEVKTQGVDGGGEYRLSVHTTNSNQETETSYVSSIADGESENIEVQYNSSSDKPVTELVSIESFILDINTLYESGDITKERGKKLLINRLQKLERHLNILNRKNEFIKRQIERLQNSPRPHWVTDRLISILIKKYNRNINNTDRIIDRELGQLKKTIDNMKQHGNITNQGYVIINSNIKSLEFNLQ
jgi:pimeloyl-ACP methyl ester carboxylesterase